MVAGSWVTGPLRFTCRSFTVVVQQQPQASGRFSEIGPITFPDNHRQVAEDFTQVWSGPRLFPEFDQDIWISHPENDDILEPGFGSFFFPAPNRPIGTSRERPAGCFYQE